MTPKYANDKQTSARQKIKRERPKAIGKRSGLHSDAGMRDRRRKRTYFIDQIDYSERPPVAGQRIRQQAYAPASQPAVRLQIRKIAHQIPPIEGPKRPFGAGKT